jgi:hypothetical protein
MSYSSKREENPKIIFAMSLLIIGFSGYEIWAGWVVSFGSRVTAEESPGLYWFIIIFHIFLGLTALFVSFFKWRKS